ncbi:ras GTPase-activating protein 2 isoform X2 [Hypanus sabinus]|uniref:ras GTPase-activating protein 2 isoform X2 n=1 Tax=Hypanus sabinus TaxID=79690 RepID=UPI0028C42B5D|nr:ras GTPase-activating protein 2 isoform X2 [Hypanus sabinus]
MAEEDEAVRILQSLRGKICEAKNLPPCHGPNKMRDCFCIIKLDQEEVYRTKVVEKSLSPFYGEDFYFEIPRSFQYLSFYIYDKNFFQKDLPFGKVSIRKEDLCKYNCKDSWFALHLVDANSEVQGKVHLEVKLNELIRETGSVCQQLVVRIIECQGLPLAGGQSGDPYASISLVGPSRLDQKRTKVKKKTSNPQFDETFYFEVTRNSSYTKKSHFQVEEENIEKLEIRYLLQPKENGNKSAKSEDLGSLRLSIFYNEDYVLPSQYYSSLNELLLKSPDVKPISASAVHILGEVCNAKQEAVLPLVRLLLHHKKLVPFLHALAELDLQQTQEVNTIFRGNSLATRCIDETMKLVGKHYLKVTLKPILDEICDSCKTCEIDPIKLKEGDNVEVNKENLRHYVERVFNLIVQSSMSCPTLMCEVFNSLQNLARKQFPDDLHVKYSAVSSFVFLRFFAVAIVSPHSFHLRPHHPDAHTFRVLTLISKTIQTLGSWCSLSKSKLSSFKESYMCEFFKLFQEDKCIDSVKKFIDEVSSVQSKEPSGVDEPIILKEGEIIKRAQGRNRIRKVHNFKKRWLRLTNREISYHKQSGKDPLYSILIKNIIAVEKVEERCFNRKNMFQILIVDRPERPLYIQASNCVEANEWVEIITRLSRCNHKRLRVYHPCAFLSGSWICCKNTDEKAAGCTNCTGGSPANIQLAIDCDREAERIFSLFQANRPRLQKMEDACGSIDVYQGPQKEQDEYSHFTIQDSRVTFKTLQQITVVVQELAKFHEQYRIKRSTHAEYGSKENPIGAK